MRRTTRLALLILAVLPSWGLSVGTDPASAPLLPAELFFQAPEFTEPAISPDGKNIGFIAQSNGHACLFRLDLQTGQPSGIFSAGEGDVESFWWVGNQRVLVQARGKEGWQYFVQDLGGAKPREIFVLKASPKSWITVLPGDPGHIVALNFWGEAYLARIDLNSGHSSKIESFKSANDDRFLSDEDWYSRSMAAQGFDDAFNRAVVSASGELRAKVWQFGHRWHVAWRAHSSQPWQAADSSSDDPPVITPAGMAADDQHLLVYARDQGDTIALMSLDPATGQRTLLAQRPDRDANGLLREGSPHGFLGVRFLTGAGEDVVYLDEAAGKFSAALDQSLPGLNHHVTSASADGVRRIVRAWRPGYPSQYYLFDGAQHRLSLLGEQRPGLQPGELGEVRPFRFQTRDGITESGYVVLPRPREGNGPGPLLVMIMDGVGKPLPVASDFLAEDQYFASRGIAVAHIAVRGTAGFGRTFEKAGDFQVAGKIVLDYEDGVRCLADSGLIDPRRVAVMGYHFGGLVALRTAATSKSFCAVAAYNAPGKLSTHAIRWLSSSAAETATIVKQAGGTKAAYEQLRQFEPESFIDQLSVPVLLGYASWYGSTSGSDDIAVMLGYVSSFGSANPIEDEGSVRVSFDRRHKGYEWYELDYRAMDKVKDSAYQTRFFTNIADFLVKTLK